MHKSRNRTTSPIFKFLPTVLLAGALLILIMEPVFDDEIGLIPIRDSSIRHGVEATRFDANPDSQVRTPAARSTGSAATG